MPASKRLRVQAERAAARRSMSDPRPPAAQGETSPCFPPARGPLLHILPVMSDTLGFTPAPI